MKLKNLSLPEICPEDAEFALNGKAYTIRKFTLEDQAWLQKTYPGENGVAQAFRDAEQILRIAFHQLPLEQQKEFQPVERERMDEETGEVIRERVGGWKLFVSQFPSATHELESVAQALTRALIGSSALVDAEAQAAIAEQASEAEKKTI